MENTKANWTLTQIGVVVSDVEKTIDRLSLLGIGPFNRLNLPPDRIEYFRGKEMAAEFDIRNTMLGNVQLELIEPLKGDSPHMEFLRTKGEGIQHVMYLVDDLSETVNALTAKGVEILLDARSPEGKGIVYVDLGAANIVFEIGEKPK
ncbi:MAG: hypothetical protein GX631_02730 [Dehalococcoidales bacterium]|nr:hypothetical protein [Dehalococcoidales bacterium]